MRGPCRVQVRRPGWAPSVTATEEVASDAEDRGAWREGRVPFQTFPQPAGQELAGSGRKGLQESRPADEPVTGARGRGRGRAGAMVQIPLRENIFSHPSK